MAIRFIPSKSTNSGRKRQESPLLSSKKLGLFLHGYKFQTKHFDNKNYQNSGITSKNGWFI